MGAFVSHILINIAQMQLIKDRCLIECLKAHYVTFGAIAVKNKIIASCEKTL